MECIKLEKIERNRQHIYALSGNGIPMTGEHACLIPKEIVFFGKDGILATYENRWEESKNENCKDVSSPYLFGNMEKIVRKRKHDFSFKYPYLIAEKSPFKGAAAEYQLMIPDCMMSVKTLQPELIYMDDGIPYRLVMNVQVDEINLKFQSILMDVYRSFAEVRMQWNDHVTEANSLNCGDTDAVKHYADMLCALTYRVKYTKDMLKHLTASEAMQVYNYMERTKGKEMNLVIEDCIAKTGYAEHGYRIYDKKKDLYLRNYPTKMQALLYMIEFNEEL